MSKIKRKICKRGYIPGYWKGEAIALVPPYHPDAKPGEYVIEEVEVSMDYPYPKVIDPKETPLKKITEICLIREGVIDPQFLSAPIQKK